MISQLYFIDIHDCSLLTYTCKTIRICDYNLNRPLMNLISGAYSS